MEDLSELLIDPRVADKFTRIFRTMLRRNHLTIHKKSSEDYYSITDGTSVLGFDISKTRYKYAKSRNADDIDELIRDICREFDILERMVSFTNGQEFLRFTIMRAGEVKKNMIAEDFLGDLRKVICYTADNRTSRILENNYLKKWEVPREVLFSVADRNMCRLLGKARYKENVISNGGSGIRYLEFKAEGNDFTVAMLMCSDFRSYISDILTPKFLVAAPSRDAMIVLSEATNNILETLGTAIVNEYQWSSCPLTTDVLLYTSAGVKVAGHFSER